LRLRLFLHVLIPPHLGALGQGGRRGRPSGGEALDQEKAFNTEPVVPPGLESLFAFSQR
jgi:hypothetical protein